MSVEKKKCVDRTVSSAICLTHPQTSPHTFQVTVFRRVRFLLLSAALLDGRFRRARLVADIASAAVD